MATPDKRAEAEKRNPQPHGFPGTPIRDAGQMQMLLKGQDSDTPFVIHLSTPADVTMAGRSQSQPIQLLKIRGYINPGVASSTGPSIVLIAEPQT